MSQFTAPDGSTFESRPAFRDYMMDNYYSIKNKSDVAPVVKVGSLPFFSSLLSFLLQCFHVYRSQNPGDLNGQVFEITDCENVTIVLMDYISQLNIDNCVGAKIFIPACEGSIFIRNCKDCVVYSCCQQLRLRECSNSSFYTFSESEVHIELSSACRFGPFHGGYSEHAEHLRKAGLNPSANSLWFQIFDHNDPEKHGRNWELIPEDEYQGAAWFPAGMHVQAIIPKSASNIPSADQIRRSQDGESYSVHQMVADAVTHTTATIIESKSAQKTDVNTFPIETALMIESALTKRISVATMLCGGGRNDAVPMQEFSDSVKFLATTVGNGEDEETQNDLSKAVSPEALIAIENLCGEKSTISVSKFMNLCEVEVNKYMNAIMDTENDAIYSEIHRSTREVTIAKPLSSKYSSAATIPRSPYDEEVTFNLDDEIDLETVFDQNRSPIVDQKESNEVIKLSTPSRYEYHVSGNENTTRIKYVQKDVVSRVTELVKKTDLYYILQVNLGFFQAYNQLPARYSVIKYEPKLWIPLKEVQSAFLSARLRLSDVHARAFVKSIKEFSKSSDQKVVKMIGSSSYDVPVFHAMKVNAWWLRKYLAYLRLPNSKSFEAWKENKRSTMKAKSDERPIQFERALSGYEHNLKKGDIKELIMNNTIIPESFLKEEVDRRLHSYVLDTDGRRELQSKMNFELKKWQLENKKMKPWRKMSQEERSNTKLIIKANLIAKKKAEIENSEKIFADKVCGELKGAAITEDIFWRYDDYCKNSRKQAKDPQIFGEWIKKYGSKFDEKLEKFKTDFEQRRFVASLRIERRQSVAAMNEIEKEIRVSIDTLTSGSNKIELQRSLERLRKNVIDAKIQGLGDGITVTKEQFDKEFDSVLAPMMKKFQDNSTMKLLAYEARNSHDGLNLNKNDELALEEKQTLCRIKELFVTQDEAAQRAIELNSKSTQKCRDNFDAWLTRKKSKEAEAKALATEEAKKEKEVKKSKQEAGQKAYKKWLKLRRKNSYKSKAENSIKSIPNVTRADHCSKGWNKDVDLADYYANMENNFL